MTSELRQEIRLARDQTVRAKLIALRRRRADAWELYWAETSLNGRGRQYSEWLFRCFQMET